MSTTTAQAIALVRKYRRVCTEHADQTYAVGEMIAVLRARGVHLNPFAGEDMVFDPDVKHRNLVEAGKTLLNLLPSADGVSPVLTDPAVYIHIEDNTAHVDFGDEVLYALAAYRRNPVDLPLWRADVNPEFVRDPYWPGERLGQYISADDLDSGNWALGLFLRAELWVRQD